MPLPKWFQLIALMLNARKGISAMQLHRTLGVTYKSAWFAAMRVRCAMADDQVDLLENLVEADECFIGGKPRHRNTDNSTANLSYLSTKRGRGTKKVPIVGFVERHGKKRVRLEVADKPLTSRYLLSLLYKYVNVPRSVAITDDFSGYRKFEGHLQHLIINHSKKMYAEGIIHTNTIEGVWSIIKNGIRGEYHVLSKSTCRSIWRSSPISTTGARRRTSKKPLKKPSTARSAMTSVLSIISRKVMLDKLSTGRTMGRSLSRKSMIPHPLPSEASEDQRGVKPGPRKNELSSSLLPNTADPGEAETRPVSLLNLNQSAPAEEDDPERWRPKSPQNSPQRCRVKRSYVSPAVLPRRKRRRIRKRKAKPVLVFTTKRRELHKTQSHL